MEIMWDAALPKQEEKVEGRPALYRQMGDELPGRAAGGDKLIDAAFDVGAYHCACVLAMDVEEAA